MEKDSWLAPFYMALATSVAAAVPLGLVIWWQVRGRLAPSVETYVGKPE